MEEAGECEKCKEQCGVYELQGCRHGFCRPCLGEEVAHWLVSLASNASAILMGMSCPSPGLCVSLLCRHDFRVIAGARLVRFLDLCCLSALQSACLPPFLLHCPSCSSHLLPSYPNSSSSLCPSCHLLLCQNCSSSLLLLPLSPPPHICSPPALLYSHTVRCFLKFSSPLHAFIASHNRPLSPLPHSKRTRSGACYGIVRSVITCCSPSIPEKADVRRKSRGPKARKSAASSSSASSPQHTPANPLFPHIAQAMDTHLLKVSWNDAFQFSHTSVQRADMQMEQLFRELTTLLTESNSKISPPVEAFFCSHEIPYTVLAGLLRNDCVQDLTDHSKLYFQLLSFLSALSEHPELLPLLCCPKSGQLDCWTQKNRWETPGSLMAEFWKLYKQATIVLQFGGTQKPALVKEIKTTFERLLERLQAWEAKSFHVWQEDAAAFFLEVWTKKFPAKNGHVDQDLKAKVEALCQAEIGDQPSSDKHPENNIVLRKSVRSPPPVRQDTKDYLPSSTEMQAYKLVMQPLQFRQVSLLDRHYFRNNVMAKMASPSSFSRSILKEMALLSTSLPLEWESSIHVRVDDCRMDVLKALVIGPAETPYQNGIFLFDLMLPQDYPNEPPSMQFLTTASGTVRFNPNLYKTGLVCLSLLGTWDGPGWQGSKSTILQLLVSVQSLIFVPDPYYNEPGYTKCPSNIPQALDYMKEQRLNTLLHSILPALRQPEPTFEDVIRTHFKLKAREIQVQCSTWKLDQSQFQAAIISASEKIQYELDKLISAES